MDITLLTSTDVQHIVRLVERKEQLLAQVAEIDTTLTSLGLGNQRAVTPVEKPAPARRKRQRRATAPAITNPKPMVEVTTPGKRTPRGALKAAIVDLLKEAGGAGLSTAEIAGKLGANPKGTYVWFYKTGKTVPEIKQIGPGRYMWAADTAPGDAAPQTPAKPAPPSKPTKPQPRKTTAARKRTRRSAK